MKVFLSNSSRAVVVLTISTIVGVLLVVASNSVIEVQATTTENEGHSHNIRSSRRYLDGIDDEVFADPDMASVDLDESNVTESKVTNEEEEEVVDGDDYSFSLDESNVITDDYDGNETNSNSSGLSSSSSCLSIIDVVCAHSNWTKFCRLLKTYDEADNYYLGNELSNTSNYTIFVPTDDSYGLVNAKLAQLSPAELLRMDLFHVYEGEMLTYDDLECGEKILMTSNDTSRTKCDKMLNDTYVNETIKYQTGNGNTKSNSLPKITDTDVYACNAIIHELDHVMHPAYLTQLYRPDKISF